MDIPILAADNVTKVYDTGKVKVEALRGVSLTLERGEMVSVMGPSGCGKTTLLNCLSGLDDLTSGSVKIEGNELSLMNDNEKSLYRAKKIGFVFQFYNLLPVLSSVENVELPLLLSGTSPKKARQTALETLEMVGLEEWKDHRPGELSGGQRQRVAIARALAAEPAIVFADEPTGDLDSNASQEIISLMVKLNNERGMTFLIVTHDRSVGEKAPRRLYMKDGRIEKDVRTPDYRFKGTSSGEVEEVKEAGVMEKSESSGSPEGQDEKKD